MVFCSTRLPKSCSTVRRWCSVTCGIVSMPCVNEDRKSQVHSFVAFFFFFCYIWLQPCLQTTSRILLNCLGILAVKSAAHTRENCWRTLRVTGRTCTKKKKECRLGCFVKATKYNVLCPRQLQNLLEIGKTAETSTARWKVRPERPPGRRATVPTTPGGCVL